MLPQPSPEQKLRLKNNIVLFYPGEEDNAIINYLINKVHQDILNFCNIEQLPEELEGVLVDMVIENLGTYRWLDKQDDIADGRVKEITEGDVTVKLLTEEEARKINASLRGKEIPFLHTLKTFRRLKK